MSIQNLKTVINTFHEVKFSNTLCTGTKAYSRSLMARLYRSKIFSYYHSENLQCTNVSSVISFCLTSCFSLGILACPHILSAQTSGDLPKNTILEHHLQITACQHFVGGFLELWRVVSCSKSCLSLKRPTLSRMHFKIKAWFIVTWI